MDDKTAPHAPPPRDLGLWVAILAGPIFWLLVQQVDYLLVYRARATGSIWPLVLVTAASMAVVAAAGWGSFTVWRRARVHQEAESPAWRRVAFMGAVGALMSLFFVAAILAFAVPLLFLNPAQR